MIETTPEMISPAVSLLFPKQGARVFLNLAVEQGLPAVPWGGICFGCLFCKVNFVFSPQCLVLPAYAYTGFIFHLIKTKIETSVSFFS